MLQHSKRTPAAAEPTVQHATWTIERSYPASPERVFAGFADPAKKRRWYSESHGPAEEFEMDFRVGGHDRAVSRMGDDTPFPGALLVSAIVYQDIVQDRRIVYAYTMTLAGRRISSSLTTVEFLAEGKGTALVLTEQGAYFEGSDGPERRRRGVEELLDAFAKEVGD